MDLSRESIGALIVIRGKDLILRHLEGGVELDGKLSEPILKSIFDPHSAGHDGAVIVEKNRISQIGSHLPLSKNMKKLGQSGTRHAAALGLSELSDALCLIVSEERGSISYANKAEIKEIEDANALSRLLEKFYKVIAPEEEKKPWQHFFKKNYREKVIALVMSLALWFVLVDGSKLVYKTYEIPVEYAKLPKSVTEVKTDPEVVEVSFSGPRRSFYFANANTIHLILRTLDVRKEKQSVFISNSDVTFSNKKVVLENVEPRRINVEIDIKEE